MLHLFEVIYSQVLLVEINSKVVTCLPALRAGIVRSCLRYLSHIMNFEQHTNIKFYFQLQKAHEMLKSLHGNNMVTLETVYKWYE